jgi:hypothetical protein
MKPSLKKKNNEEPENSTETKKQRKNENETLNFEFVNLLLETPDLLKHIVEYIGEKRELFFKFHERFSDVIKNLSTLSKGFRKLISENKTFWKERQILFTDLFDKKLIAHITSIHFNIKLSKLQVKTFLAQCGKLKEIRFSICSQLKSTYKKILGKEEIKSSIQEFHCDNLNPEPDILTLLKDYKKLTNLSLDCLGLSSYDFSFCKMENIQKLTLIAREDFTKEIVENFPSIKELQYGYSSFKGGEGFHDRSNDYDMFDRMENYEFEMSENLLQFSKLNHLESFTFIANDNSNLNPQVFFQFKRLVHLKILGSSKKKEILSKFFQTLSNVPEWNLKKLEIILSDPTKIEPSSIMLIPSTIEFSLDSFTANPENIIETKYFLRHPEAWEYLNSLYFKGFGLKKMEALHKEFFRKVGNSTGFPMDWKENNVFIVHSISIDPFEFVRGFDSIKKEDYVFIWKNERILLTIDLKELISPE